MDNCSGKKEVNVKKSRIIINIIGYIILILSIVFIIYSFRKIELHYLINEITPGFIILIVISSIIYSLVFVILAFNFSVIMSTLNFEKKTNFLIIPAYLKANIGKYLPSNIFHFASRHILMNNFGYKNKKILAGNIIEIVFTNHADQPRPLLQSVHEIQQGRKL